MDEIELLKKNIVDNDLTTTNVKNLSVKDFVVYSSREEAAELGWQSCWWLLEENKIVSLTDTGDQAGKFEIIKFADEKTK